MTQITLFKCNLCDQVKSKTKIAGVLNDLVVGDEDGPCKKIMVLVKPEQAGRHICAECLKGLDGALTKREPALMAIMER